MMGSFLFWAIALLTCVVLLLVNASRLLYAYARHSSRPTRSEIASVLIPLVVGLVCLYPLSLGSYIP